MLKTICFNLLLFILSAFQSGFMTTLSFHFFFSFEKFTNISVFFVVAKKIEILFYNLEDPWDTYSMIP